MCFCFNKSGSFRSIDFFNVLLRTMLLCGSLGLLAGAVRLIPTSKAADSLLVSNSLDLFTLTGSPVAFLGSGV